MVISITKSALSNRNNDVVHSNFGYINNRKQQPTTTELHPKNDANYSLTYSDSIQSYHLSYLNDDSNNNPSFDDDNDSTEEILKASIKNSNILLTSTLSNDDDENYSILNDDDDNELSDNMILCDVDSDTVPSTDLQSSCLAGDDVNSNSSSITNSTAIGLNSRKEVYLKIIRNETTIPRPIKYQRSCSDDIFNISYIFSKENNYY